MNHVGKIRWYYPKDQKDISKRQKLLNRAGDFKASMSANIFSNHFAVGSNHLAKRIYSPTRNQEKNIA